ncbi:hypothetical protein BZA77DRAFT_389010 [Pyronema omphalodes]|nr:hypothetical protein BZA77DRAFT_389010 [Pyronema omphalodes]
MSHPDYAKIYEELLEDDEERWEKEEKERREFSENWKKFIETAQPQMMKDNKNFIKKNPDKALSEIGLTDIRQYLFFRAQNGERPLKLSTVKGYYSTLRYEYRRMTDKEMPRYRDINKSLEEHLMPIFGIKKLPRTDEMYSVKDLYLLLQYHWRDNRQSQCHGRYFVQTAFLIQLIASTSFGPNMLDKQVWERDSSSRRVLKYKDLNLSLVRDNSGTGTILVLEVQQMYLVGDEHAETPVTYMLYEVRNSPMLCPVLNMIALAFADNAFKEAGITRPEDIYDIQIPISLDKLSIEWKPEIMETPVFQDATIEPEDVVVDSDAWSFTGFDHYLERLGLISGYPEITSAQQNEMHHSLSEDFRKYYMRQTVKVDDESLSLGTLSFNYILQTLNSAMAERYPLAPMTLPRRILDEIEKDSSLVSMNEEKRRLSNALKTKDITLTKAKDDYSKAQYRKLENKIRARKKILKRKALGDYRTKALSDEMVLEFARQRQGHKPMTLESTLTTSFNCPVRTDIAKFFASYDAERTGESSETHNLSAWFDAVRSLRDLCLQEPSVQTAN